MSSLASVVRYHARGLGALQAFAGTGGPQVNAATLGGRSVDPSAEPYWERFDNLVARFYPALGEADGLTRDAIALSESRLGLKLPGRLVEFYALCGHRDDLLSSYEQLLPPDRLRLEDGVLVFVDENQGVAQWGIRTADGDPAVWRKDFTADPFWEPDHNRLSDFLISFVLWQAVNGGAPAGGVGSADSRIFDAISSWPEFPIEGSHWTDTRFFALNGQLLCLLGKQDVSVLAAARDDAAFAALDASVQLAWDYTWPERDG